MMLVMMISPYTVCNSQSSESRDRPTLRVLFDDLHGQTFGNADWTPDAAYSDFASDLIHELNATISKTSDCFDSNQITEALLTACDVLIIPEPNTRFSSLECNLIQQYVEAGKGLFLIADHGGSDRNFDGWDACMIFNELTHPWSFLFTGNDFSEAPVAHDPPSDHIIMRGVKNVGAWAATSLILEPDCEHIQPVLSFSKSQEAYIIAGNAKNGRIIAIGDSSPFDDGTGSEGKSRHSAYRSWLYDHRRFVVQSVAWLSKYEISSMISNEVPLPEYQVSNYSNADSRSMFIIDCAHGSNEADIMNRFIFDIESTGKMTFSVNFNALESLPKNATLLVSNPNLPFTPREIKILKKWIQRHGGKLLLTVNSPRVPLSGEVYANQLLKSLGSDLCFSTDEIVDPKNNTGKPWSIVSRDFMFESIPAIRSAVFWSATSIKLPDKPKSSRSHPVSVVVSSSDSATIASKKHAPDASNAIPFQKSVVLGAIESMGKGAICLLGAPTMTNYQYFSDEDKQTLAPELWDHDTDLFNRALVLHLKEM